MNLRDAFLQWGRALSSAEMWTIATSPIALTLLQWGRALSSAEMDRS